MVHVAGTNGKGSTSAMVASILKLEGHRVGLYTSPHLIRFNERITVDGKCISNDEINSFINLYKKDIDQISSTFFETTTALAFTYFAKKKVDFAVIEVGLGGRLDSTNVVSPKVTAITPISLDHKDILGDSLLSIAKEKAGIIKKDTPLIVGIQKKSINTFLREVAKQNNSPFIDTAKISDVKISSNGTEFNTKWGKFLTPLLGYHQASNAATAITIIKSINKEIQLSIIQKGLNETVWRGRLQKLSKALPLYYDVAHNSAGIDAMIETVKSIYNKLPYIVLCLKGDKEIKLISRALKSNYEEIIVTGSHKMELMEANDLFSALGKYGLNENIEKQNDPNDAISALIDKVKTSNQPGVIMGSHYIAKAVFDKFGIL